MLLALVAVSLLLAAPPARALDGRDVIAEAQRGNGFSTWSDRKSTVTVESFDEGAGRTHEAEVYERTDPKGEHRTFIEFTSPNDYKGMRLLHVSPRGAPDEYWIWMPSQHRVRRLGGNAGGSAHREEVFVGIANVSRGQ